MTTQTSRRKFIQAGMLSSFGALAGMASEASAAEKTENSAQNASNTFDVIVLGCGIAGLVAALQAKAEGASVALFEKMDRPAGNAICALGGFCAWGSRHQIAQGVKDNAKDFYDAMMDISAGRADPALTKTYTDNIPHDTDWLESEFKIPFGKTRTAAYPRLDRVCSIEGQGLTGGANAVFKLLDAAKARGVKFFWEHKAIELLTNDLGHVIGVRVQTPEGKKEFFARGGVCIATGGFSANPEMTDKYIGGWASRLALRGSPYTTGENISLCMPLFAKFVNMDQFHTGPIVSATHVNPNQALNAYHGIIVDVHGKRFTVQYRNTAILRYRIGREERIGYTHAYIPLSAFTRYLGEDGVIVLEKDGAYIAVKAMNGLTMQQEGPNCFREFMSQGRDNVWVIRAGRMDEYGGWMRCSSFKKMRFGQTGRRPW